MAEEELEIEINPQGQVTVRTKGVKGPACMQYADLLVPIIGQEQSRAKTPEFYETGLETQHHIEIKQRR